MRVTRRRYRREECTNCGGDGYTTDHPRCPACDGQGYVLATRWVKLAGVGQRAPERRSEQR